MADCFIERVYDFEWPARELFLWCVLMRRKKLAMLFLQEEKVSILLKFHQLDDCGCGACGCGIID